MNSIDQIVPFPIGRASFLFPPELETSNPAEGKSSAAQSLAVSDDNFQETVDIMGTSGAENTARRSADNSHGSPSPAFLTDLRQPGDAVETKETPDDNHEVPNELLLQSSSYATNSDLLALERRIRTMVTETTTAINSKLMETLPQPQTGPPNSFPEPESNETMGDLWLQGLLLEPVIAPRSSHRVGRN